MLLGKSVCCVYKRFMLKGLTGFVSETRSGQNSVLPGPCFCPLLASPSPQQDLEAHYLRSE